MTAPERDVTAAWHELLDGLRAIDAGFLEGPRAVGDEQAVAEGYRMALTALGVALDTYLFADPSRPMFVDVATPFRRDRRWGGDNTDAGTASRRSIPAGATGSAGSAATAPTSASPSTTSRRRGVVRPHRGQRQRHRPGPRRRRPVLVRDRPAAPAGYDGLFVALDDDAAIAFTRDYQVDRSRAAGDVGDRGARPARPLDRTDEATAAALRAALRWVRTLFAIVPLAAGAEGPADDASGTTRRTWPTSSPSPTRSSGRTTGGRRATPVRAGTFALEPGEALVVTHRPPDVPVLEPHRVEPVHGHRVAPRRPDLDQPRRRGAERRRHGHGRDRHDRLAHPNAISTAGRADGALAFRWFLAD